MINKDYRICDYCYEEKEFMVKTNGLEINIDGKRAFWEEADLSMYICLPCLKKDFIKTKKAFKELEI